MKPLIIHGAVVTRKWEGVEKTSPFGIEFQTTEGTLFDLLYRYFAFDQLIEGAVTLNVPSDSASFANEVARIEKLKKDLVGGKVKISIKLEVEKLCSENQPLQIN